jgi:hypothetical protein
MVTVIRPSRARCVKGTIPRQERAVLTFKEGRMLVASTSVVGFGFRSGVIVAVLPSRARLLVLVRWRARGRARQARLPLSGVRARRPAIRPTPRGPRRATSWSAPIPIQVECDNRNGARGQMSYVQYRGAIQMCRRCQSTIGGTSRVRRATNMAVLTRAERCH